MSGDPATTSSACPCDDFVHPRPLFNPPGRATLGYRVGEFASFRRALLLSRPGEAELVHWRPGGEGDLAVQMVEWWAYLLDILTFYNERHAHQAYLRTADLPPSVRRLIRVLGYRPRPAIAATGRIAALVNGRPAPFPLERGYPVQSKPGPGKQPQIFETDADVVLGVPDAVPVTAPPDRTLNGASNVLVAGAVAGTVKPGERLLLLPRAGGVAAGNWALATVAAATLEKDPDTSKPNTRIAFTAAVSGLPSNAQTTGYRLLRATQTARLWPHATTAAVIGDGSAHLEAITRGLEVGQPVVFESAASSGAPAPQAAQVTAYSEAIWFANPPDPARPETGPAASTNIPGIPIPHGLVSFSPNLAQAATFNTQKASVLVRFGWQEVAPLVGKPPAAPSAPPPSTLEGAGFPGGAGRPALLEDRDGNGALVRIDPLDAARVRVTNQTLPAPALAASGLRLLTNLLPVSRGRTVPDEVLGSGNAALTGQEFTLAKKPLTYLPSAAASVAGGSGGVGYRSTLRVRVNGVEWREAPSFYGQPPDAPVFVTREDEDGATHVLFGDGVNGARLPSGVDNVVATYRYGGGAEAPEAGSLNVIVRPHPGIKALRNPVAVGGGADPDPPDQIRRYAPRSVLTFNRAVSGDDYETLAAQTPGVARARAYWAFDAELQRTAVTVYVGDDAHAVSAARTALAGAGDPNRPVVVKPAVPVRIALLLAVRVAPGFLAADVVAGVRAALLAPDTGLFGARAVRIGKTVYRSEIYAACLSVPGAVAVPALFFVVLPGTGFFGFLVEDDYRHLPGEGGFYRLADSLLFVFPEASPDAAAT